MSNYQIYFEGLFLIIGFLTLIWVISTFIKNAGIVDIFWGLGFVLLNGFYYLNAPDNSIRSNIILLLVAIWGLRLSIHIFRRNKNKSEDFRYREFRKRYGEERYWWVSYFQVFLLQGVLLWLISAPLFVVNFYGSTSDLNLFDYLGIFIWLIGFTFESLGDWQLTRFKANPSNRGKLLKSGFWKITRHPNYFGDAAVWWGFGLFSIACGIYIPALSSLLMTVLLLKISGVDLLEKTLKQNKPGYMEYVNSTNAFFPWFPKKRLS